MVYCVAVGCSSNSCSKKAGSVSFFQLPKDAKLRATWLSKIKRKNLPKDSGRNITLCHLHFEQNCFERDLIVNEKWFLFI